MACSRLGLFNVKNTALFVCDLQEKFRHSIQYFPQIVEVASRLLRAADTLDVPVIVTEQYPNGLGHTVEELGIKQFPKIVPVAKTQFSMLTSDILQNLANNHPSVTQVVLCGIEAHVCVQGTCLQLLEKGYEVHIVVDGCSSRTLVDRMYAFDRMKASGAWLTTSESVILGLLGDSKHPKFRECQKLIMNPAPDSGLLSSAVGLNSK